MAAMIPLLGCLIAFGVASLILNGLFLFTFVRRKRLRTPCRYLLAHLAIIDILAVGFWTAISAVNVLQDGFAFSFGICKLQRFFMGFCMYMNMHTFLFLAFERTLLVYFPSRHAEIFIGKVMMIVIPALWIFDGVLVIMPITDWGLVAYFSNQYQCNMDYDYNVRQMNFMTAMSLGISSLFLILCFVLIFVRIKRLRKNITPEGAMILEVNEKASGDSYADRLRKQQLRFQNAGRKRKKPTMAKTMAFTEDGYESNNESSDEEDKKNNLEARKDEDDQVVIKKVYYFAKTDYIYIKSYLINSILYVLMWYPYFIMIYVMIYEFDTLTVSDGVATAVVWITHATCFVKPLVYFLFNSNIRGHVRKAFCRKKYTKFGSDNRQYASENTENVQKQDEMQSQLNISM